MGILSVQCEGRQPKSGIRCTHRFWRLLTRPAVCPLCGTSAGVSHCVDCGAPLAEGARFCGKCSRPKPTEVTEELWALPDGAFAVQHRIEVSPTSTTVYVVVPGVRVLALVDGYTPTDGSSGDYVRLPSAADGHRRPINASELGKVLTKRLNRSPVGMSVVIVSDGPIMPAMEITGVRGKDHIPMDVSVRISVELTELKRFVQFMGPRRVVTSEEIDVAVAELAGPALTAVLGQWTVPELAVPEARRTLATQLAADVAVDLARMGMRLTGVLRLQTSSEVIERSRAGRADVREHELETQMIAEAIKAQQDRAEVLLSGRQHETEFGERSEEDNERRRKLTRTIRDRVTADRINEYQDADRFERLVRDAEHQLGLQGMVREDEMRAMRDKCANGARVDQLLSDIELRKVVRETEVTEVIHGVTKNKILDDDRIARAKAEADLRREIEEKNRASTRLQDDADQRAKHDALVRKVELDKSLSANDHELDEFKKDKSQQRAEAAAAAAHERELALTDAAHRRSIEELEVKKQLTVPVLIALQTQDPEVYKALIDAERPRDDRVKLLEERIEQLLRDKESSQQAELARVMSLAKEAMQRMAETAAATASTRSTINVNSPTRPAGGPRANG